MNSGGGDEANKVRVQVRFNDDDMMKVETLRRLVGLRSRADVVRMAVIETANGFEHRDSLARAKVSGAADEPVRGGTVNLYVQQSWIEMLETVQKRSGSTKSGAIGFAIAQLGAFLDEQHERRSRL